jgi:D-threo-aldose 1-dehydrogenase
MRYRTLGRTGIQVSEIGIGGIGPMGKYGPVAEDGTSPTPAAPPDKLYRHIPHFDVAVDGFARTMARASELGVNVLDTAPSYGDSEVVFGHYLKDPARRRQWVVCTKTGVCGNMGDGGALESGEIIAQVEASLRRLQIEQIDILLIHSIDQYGCGEEAVERVIQAGMVEALEQLKEAGKIRCFGVSGQLPELIPAARTGLFDVTLAYATYNLLVRDAAAEFLPLARQLDLGVLLGGVFHSGLLAGDPSCQSLTDLPRFFETQDPGLEQADRMVDSARRLQALAGGRPADLRRLGLRFALSHPAVSTIVSGVRSIDEIEENATAIEAGILTEAETADLEQVVASLPPINWTYD